MYIYPYRSGSRSALALGEALGARLIRHERSRFVGGGGKTVVNWGASEVSAQVGRCRVLNPPDRVRVAGNKLLTFGTLSPARVSIPQFTQHREEAINWIEGGTTVVARRVLTGHSGQGVVILQRGDDFVEAPLYTKYIPKDREYRLHIVKNRQGEYVVVDVQRKVKDPEREVTDWKVRSHDNGFIFIRTSEDGRSYREAVEPQVRDQALLAMRSLNLDFGAVDMIWNRKAGCAYCLEINSAPGITGETINTYENALRGL